MTSLPLTGFTLDWYRKLFSLGSFWPALWNSLIIAVAVAIVSVVIGTLAALALARMRPQRANLLIGALSVPMMLPALIIGVALMSYFVRMIEVPLGLPTVVLGHLVIAQPFVILGKNGNAKQTFATLKDAVDAVQSGDTIEIRGDGPFARAIRTGQPALLSNISEHARASTIRPDSEYQRLIRTVACEALLLIPAVWFLGLERWMLATDRSDYELLARIAVWSSVVTTATIAVTGFAAGDAH